MMQKLCVMIICLAWILPVQAAIEEYSSPHNIYFSENWESGQGLWYSSNGIWEVGQPTVYTTAHQGTKCLGTDLDGHFPDNSDSRFISPTIDLPADPVDGALWLRFWHAFRLEDSDYGYVQISVDGGDFVTISRQFNNNCSRWSPFILDLSEYAGQSVRLGFMHNEGGSYENYGWYIDDIEILDGHFEWLNPEGFERSVQGRPRYDGWYAENGIWEIGTPTTGASPYSGKFCAGTALTGDYPDNTDSRLVSPLVTLPDDPLGGQLWLSLMQAFVLEDSDTGQVQIWTEEAGWTTISLWDSAGYSQGWMETIIDLNPYLGQTVRFGFYHNEAGSYEAQGWFIDDIALVQGPRLFNNPNTFEGGTRGWFTTQGIWDIGSPTSGPGSAHSGEYCWATNLNGHYADNNSSTLLTPCIQLPTTYDPQLLLRFWHWFSFQDSDNGRVFLYPEGDTSQGILISHVFSNSSDGWGQYLVDLADYAGQRVSFGFHFTEGGSYEDAGWYIDDVEIIGMDQSTPPDILFVGTSYSQAAPVVSWAYIPFDPAYTSVYYSHDHDFIPNLGNRIAMLTDDTFSFVDADRAGWYHYYRIGLVDDLGHENTPAAVPSPPAHTGEEAPRSLGAASMQGSHPNPFNPMTEIEFTMHRDSHVLLEVFDLRGHKVRTLVDEEMAGGQHRIPFNGQGLASGTYLCRLKAGATELTTKMTLVR